MKLLITSSKPCTEPAMSVRVASVKYICIQLLQIMFMTAVSETNANLAWKNCMHWTIYIYTQFKLTFEGIKGILNFLLF